MQKFVALSGLLFSGLILSAGSSSAQTIISGNSSTKQTLTNGQTLTVTGAGKLANPSGTLVTVAGTSTTPANQISITNSGTISTAAASGGGRAIRDNSGGSNLLITNNAGALIQSAQNDTIAINVGGSGTTTSVVDIENRGTIQSLNAGGNGTTTPTSKGNQAINMTVTTGSNIVNNYSTGVIWSTAADGVRPGVNGVVHNDGLIFSNQFFDTTATPPAMTSSDGVDAQSDTGITIVNGFTTTAPGGNVATFQGAVTGYVGNQSDVAGKTQSTIEGGRHGITGGNTDPAVNNGAYAMTVVNNAGAKILGDNGSGINIDGINGNELVTITNAGTIQGNGHSAADGLSHDGDGVDVDGLVNLNNSGTIKSVNAFSSTGEIERSEGVTVGGGTIVNSGTIEGSVAAGNTTAIGVGITLAGVDKDVNNGDAPFNPPQAVYANTSVTNNAGGLIKGDTASGIAIEGIARAGFNTYNISVTNNASASIIGGGTTDAAIEAGITAFNSTATMNNLTIVNSGTIDGSSSGKAIDFGNGTNSLTVTGGSASILGNITGGTGTNTVTIDPGAGNTFSYGGVMSKISSVEDKSGTVILTGANIYTGNTTISGGTTYVNNTTGSGTGTGKIAVSTGAAFGGSGTVQSGSGNGITLASGSTLISGGIQSGTTAGHGLTLDNTVAQGTILDASIGSANLTFYLGAGTTAGAGPNTFGTPNKNSSYATILGDIANELKFATGDTVTLTDLTSGNLQLNLSIPYLLIQAGSNADYSGLVTTGGVVGGVAQNGYVTNLTLLGNTTGEYAGAKLYLFNGKLEAEAVPEPSSWMLACFAAAIFVLIRRRQLKS